MEAEEVEPPEARVASSELRLELEAGEDLAEAVAETEEDSEEEEGLVAAEAEDKSIPKFYVNRARAEQKFFFQNCFLNCVEIVFTLD